MNHYIITIDKFNKTITMAFRYYRQTGIYKYSSHKELMMLKVKLKAVIKHDVVKKLRGRI